MGPVIGKYEPRYLGCYEGEQTNCQSCLALPLWWRMTRSKADIISHITETGIVCIIRAQQAAQVQPMFEALISAGVTAIEITLTTPNALEGIREARKQFGGRAVIGAGTIVTPADCRAAIEAGAEFIVTPICRPELVAIAHAAGRPIMLGAYTPTEAQTAYEAGSDFVKIFPAETLGPGFIKALLAPLPHLRIVPTGGVNAQNVGEFLKAGCAALGVGTSLVAANLLKEGNWTELKRRAVEFVSAVKQARQNKAG